MQMVKIPVQVTKAQKAHLEQLRKKGTTASGYIRCLLDREINHAPAAGQKGR